MNRLKILRESGGLTQAELAKKTNLNKRTIQHYEQGVLSLNNAAAIKVYRLAKILGCEMSELLDLPNENT